MDTKRQVNYSGHGAFIGSVLLRNDAQKKFDLYVLQRVAF